MNLYPPIIKKEGRTNMALRLLYFLSLLIVLSVMAFFTFDNQENSWIGLVIFAPVTLYLLLRFRNN